MFMNNGGRILFMDHFLIGMIKDKKSRFQLIKIREKFFKYSGKKFCQYQKK